MRIRKLPLRHSFHALLALLGLVSGSSILQAFPPEIPRAVMPTVPKRDEKGEIAWEAVPEGEIEKIRAALPKKAAVTPKKSRKLLVFYRADGYPHASIPHWNKFIQLLGEQTGAFSADFSQSYDDLTPENLSKYDALFFNNTCRMKTPEPVKQALQDFVKSGKGFAGNHGSGDNWHDWPEGKEMIGCEFVSHPFGNIQIKVDDPQSPLTAVFEGKSFPFFDEVYAFTDPYSRKKLRVLLSIDYPNSPDVPKQEERIRTKAAEPDAKDYQKAEIRAVREDKDYAISWIRAWDKGRVFYCSLGHWSEVLFFPAVTQYYLSGIQYALGDLEANDKPSEQ